jgi:hypothetical protein
MSRSLIFPDKYHIVWLDAHIGDPQFCVQLKRAFFTHVDPESGDTVSLSDQDIDRYIHSNSEISTKFDNFHFTLKAFTDETPCLQYIEEIQNDRILFIASSRLGQPAVEVLLKRYRHSFTNKNTNEPYNSIYIFCSNIRAATKWACDYYEYVHIFNFEQELLTRMIRDLGEEFLDQGKQLMEANQYESAVERLCWAKSLFTRYDQLIFLSETKQADQNTKTNTAMPERSSQKSIDIDELLNLAEEQLKQQTENNTDQASRMRSEHIDPNF